jgi:PfaB family protein
MGLGAWFGGEPGLPAFEHAMYYGGQTVARSDGSVTAAGIATRVADEALRHACVAPGAGVGVIVAAETDPTSLALQVAARWRLVGPALGIDGAGGAASLATMFDTARDVLATGVEAVLAVTVEPPPAAAHDRAIPPRPTSPFDRAYIGLPRAAGGGAMVLGRFDAPEADGCPPASLATIDAWAVAPTAAGLSGAIGAASRSALAAAGRPSMEVGYLETSGRAVPPDAEIAGLGAAYSPSAGHGYALAGVAANIGDSGLAGGMASLIRVVLALAQGYLPATPGWTGPREARAWALTPFFVPTTAYPWFVARGRRRAVGLSDLGRSGEAGHVVVSSDPDDRSWAARFRRLGRVSLVTATGRDPREMLDALGRLDQRVRSNGELTPGSDQRALSRDSRVVAIVGRTSAELLGEIAAARQAVPTAFDAHHEWQTPRGSYFTPHPIGGRGRVAFVYPGAFSAYTGMARDLFRAFPSAYAALAEQTSDPGGAFAETLVYPRVIEPLSGRDLAQRDTRLAADPIAAIEAAIASATVYTHVLCDVVGLQPAAAFGYSLGEATMLWALGVWTAVDASRQRFRTSPLFRARLGGPREAVRAYRAAAGFAVGDGVACEAWATYTLTAPVDEVGAALDEHELAYLTIVNGPAEVVIAGDPGQCQAVIDRLGCEHLRMGFDYALHCPVAISELDEFARINTNPTRARPDVAFYSADRYAPLTLEPDQLAGAIARMSCKRLDFVRLVERVYEHGARIFVEVGPNGGSARLVDAILAGREHLAVASDRRGADAETAIYGLLARMVSHQTPGSWAVPR